MFQLTYLFVCLLTFQSLMMGLFICSGALARATAPLWGKLSCGCTACKLNISFSLQQYIYLASQFNLKCKHRHKYTCMQYIHTHTCMYMHIPVMYLQQGPAGHRPVLEQLVSSANHNFQTHNHYFLLETELILTSVLYSYAFMI